MKIIKKTLILILSLCMMTFDITRISADEKSVYTDTFTNDGVSYELYLEESEEYTKSIVKGDDGSCTKAYFDKENNTLYQDGKEVDFAKSIENEVIHFNKLDQDTYSIQKLSDWDPIYVSTYNIDCSPLIKSASTVVAILSTLAGYKLASYLQLKDGAGKVLIQSTVAMYGGKVGEEVTSKANVKFSYRLYRTRNPVLISGATIKYTAWRYQDYTCRILWDGVTKSKTSYTKGEWWTSNKPF